MTIYGNPGGVDVTTPGPCALSTPGCEPVTMPANRKMRRKLGYRGATDHGVVVVHSDHCHAASAIPAKHWQGIGVTRPMLGGGGR